MKKTKSIRRIGMVANCSKPLGLSAVRKAAALIQRAGRSVATDSATAQFAQLKTRVFPSIHQLAAAVDLVLVFGGDGTMLRVARETNGTETPLLGINLGGLGFLTDVTSSNLPRALRQLWNHEYAIESRALVEARSEGSERPIHCTALNDIVVSRGMVSRLIELEVRVDGEILTTYRCDGLIFSSPTGSTAYSLAAGGAVVCPTAEVFTITPICPHTLSNRSVILSLDSIIEVQVLSQRPETILSADGQGECVLTAGDIIRIRRSEHAVRLIHLQGTSFFKTLRQKLQWSGSHLLKQ